ncbi:Peptidase C14, caspase catalytic domain protein [Rhodopirellula sallentina SM41]|uniref:Peptidase C14, caspase catalytic domain protein n=2 Tax=Rhodopirellula TaxID=265488 RepID=M5U6N4_9BACT|nr:Peptidase C14, caspase catalytic domain protein [Rhodopirellula sallentina SM41]
MAMSTIFGIAANLHAESMHALVIGNAAYPEGRLVNPANDARLMDKTLRELGFEVTTRIDQTQEQMDREIADFCRRVPKNGLAFFFFAGHGLQINGENYLVPVDAKIHDAVAVKYKTVSQNFVMDSLDSSSSNMNVVVLDCCRDNPFQRAWKRSIRGRGLAPTSVIPEGTLIAYATAPGHTALDGEGTNSPYTLELAKAFSQRPASGLLLRDVFFTASSAVKKATGQRPWLNLDASLDAFYLRQPNNLASREEMDEVVERIESGEPLSPSIASSELPAPAGDSDDTKPAAKPTAQPITMDEGAIKSTNQAPQSHSLVRQANTFLYEGDYDLAIDAFSALIGDSSIPEAQRRKMRKSRGVAYLGRRGSRDIERAIVDYKASGSKGVHMSIMADQANLKVGTEIKATIRKNQIALVTLSKGDWLWIESVQDDRSIQGWVNKSVFTRATQTAKQFASDSATSGGTKRNESKPIVSSQPISSSRPVQGNHAMSQTTQSFSSGIPTQSSTVSPGSSSRVITNQGVVQSVPMQSSGQFSSSQFSQNTIPQSFTQNGQSQPTRTYSNQSSSQFQSQQPSSQSSNRFFQNNGFLNSNQSRQSSSRSNTPSGADGFTKKFMERNGGRPPSIWQTPKWESPAEIRRLRAKGLVR